MHLHTRPSRGKIVPTTGGDVVFNEQKAVNPDKVAVYVRWSTDGQDKGTTLEVQIEKCRQFFVFKEWNVNDALVYIDDGHSGSSLDRPAMKRLREDVKAGLVEAVVVYKLDRLSRSIVDTVQLVLEEWTRQYPCVLYSTQESFDTSGDLGKLIFSILAMFADFERSTIRARTLGGKRKRAEQGRNAGFTSAYGYTSKDGDIQIVEEHAAIVRRMFDDCIAGRGSKTIAGRLNEEGVPAPGVGRKAGRNGRWGDGSIRKILANPAYTGRLTYGRTAVNPRHKKGDTTTKSRLKGDAIVVERAFEAIVSDEIFELAQERMAERTATMTAPRAASSPYLLSGIARCAKCGYMMAGNTSGKGNNVQYYMCNGHRQKISDCGARTIRRDALDAEVLARVREAFSVENRATLIEQAKERYGDDAGAARLAVSAFETELTEISEAKQGWIRDYERKAVDAELMSERVAVLKEREQATSQKLDAAKASLRRVEAKLHEVDDEAIAKKGEQLVIWDKLDVEQKKRLFRQFVERVDVYKGPSDDSPELTITFKSEIAI